MQVEITKQQTRCIKCMNFSECRTTTDIVLYEMKHKVKVLVDGCEKFEERKVRDV